MSIKALAKIREEANERFNTTVESLKANAFSVAKEKIMELISGVLGMVAISSILQSLTLLKDSTKAAQTTYTTAKTSAEMIKAQTIGGSHLVIQSVKETADAYKRDKLGISDIELDSGISEKMEVIANVYQSAEPDGSDIGLILKTNGAKVKLNSIEELVNAAREVNKKLKNEDAATTRMWVNKIRKTHPLVDEKIAELEFFKPISNEMGATYLQYTPDTPSLALEDWETNIPNPFRRSLQNKIGREYESVNAAYHKLNKAMCSNLSTEFYYIDPDLAMKNQAFNWLNKSLLSNDYHIAGDFTFAEDHVNRLQDVLMIALVDYVGGAGRLINWLANVNTYDMAMNGMFEISVEGENVVVDLRGNKIGVIASVIDKSPISLSKEDLY